jgi:hypothetical protein
MLDNKLRLVVTRDERGPAVVDANVETGVGKVKVGRGGLASSNLRCSATIRADAYVAAHPMPGEAVMQVGPVLIRPPSAIP